LSQVAATQISRLRRALHEKPTIGNDAPSQNTICSFISAKAYHMYIDPQTERHHAMLILSELTNLVYFFLFLVENQPQGTDSPDGAMMPPATSFLADLPPLGNSDIIHAGFQDCTEQTIQYLVQVENMSMEDPIIMGLRQHLAKKRLNLDCEDVLESETLRTNEAETCNFLSNNIHPLASAQTSDDTTDSLSAEAACGSRSDSVCADGFDEVDGPSSGHSDSNENKSFSDMSAGDDSLDSNSHSNSNLDPSPFEQFVTEGEGHEDIDNLTLLEQLPNLTVLAQSNPAIAQLAGQIMSMIEEDDDPLA
jgi:hypothetical protein